MVRTCTSRVASPTSPSGCLPGGSSATSSWTCASRLARTAASVGSGSRRTCVRPGRPIANQKRYRLARGPPDGCRPLRGGVPGRLPVGQVDRLDGGRPEHRVVVARLQALSRLDDLEVVAPVAVQELLDQPQVGSSALIPPATSQRLPLGVLRHVLGRREAGIQEGAPFVAGAPLTERLHEVLGVVGAKALDVLRAVWQRHPRRAPSHPAATPSSRCHAGRLALEIPVRARRCRVLASIAGAVPQEDGHAVMGAGQHDGHAACPKTGSRSAAQPIRQHDRIDLRTRGIHPLLDPLPQRQWLGMQARAQLHDVHHVRERAAK